MTTANDIIRRSLLDIGVLEGGENPAPEEAADALTMLNDMLDAWSIESQMIFNTTEIAFVTPTNTIEYTIGDGGTINSTFTGSIAGNVLTVTALTSGSISQNMTLRGTGIPLGTKIIETGTGSYGNGNPALGTYFLDRALTVASTTITGFYERFTRIDKAYVRVTYQLNNPNNYGQWIDYPVDVLTLEQYQLIGIKALPGPWVKAVYYNPGQDLGQLYVFPNPGMGELHLFVQTLFTGFPLLTTDLTFYKGYVMAMRWSLAELLMPQYGKASSTQAQIIIGNARRYRGLVKKLNTSPAHIMQFDEQILRSRGRDAGWILGGGFY